MFFSLLSLFQCTERKIIVNIIKGKPCRKHILEPKQFSNAAFTCCILHVLLLQDMCLSRFSASFSCEQLVTRRARKYSSTFVCVFSPYLSLRIYTGRVRTKQPLSTASSVSSQVDSRGRSRTKMVSQSQRTYQNTQQYFKPRCE